MVCRVMSTKWDINHLKYKIKKDIIGLGKLFFPNGES